MGFDKLAADLDGQSVLRRTLGNFLAAECIAAVVIVCPDERWELLGAENFLKLVSRVDGGENRQDSVTAGLAAVSTDYVAVHDGARPLVSPADIDRCVAAAHEHRAAALARRVTETLKRSNAENFATTAISREQVWFMETPQIFETVLLRQAYAAVVAGGLTVTDEASAMEQLRVPVKLVESSGPNIKITTPADLVLAAAILKS
jgi:2-C-methyl-D-erythritol 4-phosphate cytidylyltransferase